MSSKVTEVLRSWGSHRRPGGRNGRMKDLGFILEGNGEHAGCWSSRDTQGKLSLRKMSQTAWCWTRLE